VIPPGPEVVTLGECMAVLYPAEPVGLVEAGSLLLDVAGTEANTAIALARLGIPSRFLSRVGDDPFGQRIGRTLEREGVDVRFILVDSAAATGVLFREALPDGRRRVHYYRAGSAASRLQPADLVPEAFEGARVVHLTGITPALSASCEATVHQAMARARAVGAAVSFDPNYRAKLWTPDAARRTLEPLLRQVDILLVGDEDARALWGAEDPDAALRAARDAAPRARVVVLKLAERGATAVVGEQRATVAAAAVTRVVDPVGAGDGFNAGFLAGWLRGAAPEEALALGARVGAAAVAVLGDYAGYPRASTQR